MAVLAFEGAGDGIHCNRPRPDPGLRRHAARYAAGQALVWRSRRSDG
ncbi:MAG TPA: hypothetical protein PKZ38_08910 [Dermatophilaceae bacterium]|nr:hypothetical protein [Dermatophilaceae bacterium]